jgi:hypothetical protein
MQHIHQCQERTGSEFNLFTETKARRVGLEHPARDLQRLAIGMPHRHRAGSLAWPRNDV